MKTVEIVTFQPASSRTVNFFKAMTNGAASVGLNVVESNRYRGHSPLMMFWGYGAPERAAAMKKHVENGGRAIAWDLAYWQRDVKARVSIDAGHPSALVMRRSMPPNRLEADGARVTDSWNPKGPIVIAGQGPKANVYYGADVVAKWESEIAAECQRRWPGRPIVYRKKKTTSPVPDWATSVSCGGEIEHAIAKASLVITWHSNVAVDAIRLGIPVVCRDGAAAAVCPSMIPDDLKPLPVEVRDQFLANLAWWQWAPTEAIPCWRFLLEVLA